jgi:DoxX-like protein
METTPQTPLVSKKMIWAGRIMSAVPVLMLALSAVMKFMKPPAVLEGFAHLGFPVGMITGLGVLELLCVIVYLIPSTAILGAILVTAYLGGATVTTLRTGDAYYGPIVLGVLIWGGLFLRDPRIRALIPFRH